MKRRTIILLAVAAVVGVGGYFLWSVFRQAMWSHILIHGGSAAYAIEYWGMNGPQEDALEFVVVNDRASGTATIHLLGGTAAVDKAMRERFDRPSPAHPLPSPAFIDYGKYREPQDVIIAEDEYGRTIPLLRGGHGWLVDLRPLEVREVTVEEASASREAMMLFAECVKDGDFVAFEEAVAAYRAAGLWEGFNANTSSGLFESK